MTKAVESPNVPLPKRLALGLAGILLVASPTLASERVILLSGKTFEAESFRMDGPRVVFTLAGGGEVGYPPVEIARVEPRTSAGGEGPAPLKASVPPTGEFVSPASPSSAGKPHVSPLDPEPGVRAMIRVLAGSVGVEPRIVEAMVEVESNFDPYAVSHRGAMGLMQLMPGTAKRFQVGNVFDPEENLQGGMQYLKNLLGRYGDLALALAAYNAGEDAVDRHRGVPPYPETRLYVRRILAILNS
jgi:Transglycosylase SLT domain